MDIVSRLKFFMESSNIAISQFADTCNIPRPTMSQILNGRNKKISDELITKIHLAYPQLSVLWLMFGEGQMGVDENIQFSKPLNEPKNQNFQPQQADYETIFSSNQQNMNVPEIASEKNFDTTNSQISANPVKSLDIFDENNNTAQHLDIIDFDQSNDFPPIHNTEPEPIAPAPLQAETNNNTTPSRDKTPFSQEFFSSANTTNANDANNSSDNSTANHISLTTEPNKRITNIVVFYSDNSFQSFYPFK